MIQEKKGTMGWGELAFLLLVASFFFKLGSDNLEQPALRIVYIGFLLAGFLLLPRKDSLGDFLKTVPAAFFASFFAFQIIRLLWAVWQICVRGLGDSLTLPLYRYLSSPVTWLLYFGFFTLSLMLFRARSQVHRLLWILTGCAFVLALTAIPPLIIHGALGYAVGDGRFSFFPPFFYFHPIIPKYLISRYAHPNYLGSVISLGFFPALGLFFYRLQQRSHFVSWILPGLLVATEALAIVLLFSRATIICFAVAFLVFLLATLIKYPSRVQLISAAVAFLLVASFILWAGNIQATIKEVETIQGELKSTKQEASFSANREGAKRALAIYQTFTLWGVGTRGYASVSDLFATVGVKYYAMRKYKAYCHFLQTLAEEGTGTYLYFLFILAYFFEAARGLLKTKSRFQFMAGLSLSMPPLMIFALASVSPLIDYFAVAAPVYILMGATLAVLRGDFEHH